MGVIKMQGSGRQYFSYKQGWWYDKNVTEGDDFQTKTLKDKDGEDIEVAGQFESAIGGMITGLNVKEVESGGRKFKVLEVDIDDEVGKERLSMGVKSQAAHTVMETFENIDFTKPVVLVSWQDKQGYNKLNVKQDNEHVKNSFISFEEEDGKYTMKTHNGYPTRPEKGASDSAKDIARAQKQDFLETHFTTKVLPLVPEDPILPEGYDEAETAAEVLDTISELKSEEI